LPALFLFLLLLLLLLLPCPPLLLPLLCSAGLLLWVAARDWCSLEALPG
jgi:hypothetical protein